MICLKLFLSFLQVGAFSFGGGYAAVPLIEEQVVSLNGWLSMSEFTDLITISEMTPGPIAINSATFVGMQVAGLAGAAAATLGCILPSCLLVTLLARFYLKYRRMSLLQDILRTIRPAVVAMIASAGISILVSALWGGWDSICLRDTDFILALIFLLSLAALRKLRPSPILVILSAGVLRLILGLMGI